MTTAALADRIAEACAAIPFPKELPRELARATTVALAQDPRVEAVCLTGSLARGVADEQSDLHLLALQALTSAPPRGKVRARSGVPSDGELFLCTQARER
jgi:hypothetical protein